MEKKARCRWQWEGGEWREESAEGCSAKGRLPFEIRPIVPQCGVHCESTTARTDLHDRKLSRKPKV